MNIAKKACAVAAVFAACVTAMPAAAAPQADGMEVFRTSYFAKEKAERNSVVRVILYGPSFRADTEFGALLRSDGTMLAEGSVNWVYTDLATGETKRVTFPAFVEQSRDRLSLYGNRGGWSREDFVGAPFWILKALVTDDIRLLSANAETVKAVALQDSLPGQKSMRVTLDGTRLAELARQYAAEQGADDSDPVTDYLAQGLAQTEPVVAWVVDEKTKETITVYADLTKVMQKYAQSVLEGSYKGDVTLSEDEKAFLNSIGYYCNLQMYFSPAGKDARKPVLSNEAKRAQENGRLLEDLRREAVDSVKGK